MLEPLLIAQLDPGQIEHAVLHGREHALATARFFPMEQGGHDAERQIDAGSGIADLRPGHHRRTVVETRGRCRSPGALGDVLVDLAVLVGTRPEALDRGIDHARVELLDPFPGKPHTVDRARREIFHQNIAGLDQLLENLLAGLTLGVEGHRPLVGVEHREIEGIDVRQVAQLGARDVADAGPLHLDHVGAEPGQKLRAGWP